MNTLTILFLTVSQANNLPNGLLSSLCFVESGHNVAALHKMDGNSHSRGVCQIKRGVAKALGFKGTPQDLMKPEINVKYAGKLLAYQIKRCGSVEKGVLAYNSGKCTSGNPKYLNKVLLAQKQGK